MQLLFQLNANLINQLTVTISTLHQVLHSFYIPKSCLKLNQVKLLLLDRIFVQRNPIRPQTISNILKNVKTRY